MTDAYQFILLQSFGVDTVRVVDTTVILHHTDTFDLRSVQVAHGVQSNVTQALPTTTSVNHHQHLCGKKHHRNCVMVAFATNLNDARLALEASRNIDHIHKALVVNKVFNSVKNTLKQTDGT